jgi:hypothetical protein
MKKIFAVTFMVALVGCAGGRTSGAMQIGPDTYRIVAAAMGADEVMSQKRAFGEANQYCSSLGRKMVTTNTRSGGTNGYAVTFRCLNEGDPDLVRPILQREPDTLIQVK